MDDILTIAEAAEYLHKHADTLRRWVHNQRLPAKKIAAGGSGVWVILKTDLLECALSLSKRNRTKELLHPKRHTAQRMLPI
ncbi:helix-turn-helix domain-containing protein [Patescibacteria group bacterium]|nr:helix-turn-helix domain-containing protein [Patescibacteria group bacterium]